MRGLWTSLDQLSRLMVLLLLAAAVGASMIGFAWQRATSRPSADLDDYTVSFTPGSPDEAGRFMGGTEIRALVAHAGKLYAGNSYWQDEPGPEARQSAQVLVLDSADARWRVDHAFEDRLPNGRWRDLAVSILDEVTFETDGTGRRLPAPVAMLIASNWDVSGQLRVFTRDDATGSWTAADFPDRPTDGTAKPQVRSFASYRDKVTGVDHVFVGQRPDGIFSGTYDVQAANRIRWNPSPELDIVKIGDVALPIKPEQLRVSSFAVCNDRLFAAVGQQVYQRIDGSDPSWRLIYTNPTPGRSETGLRGLTAMTSPRGDGQVLIAAVEGSEGRIVRIDPRDGSEATELELKPFLSRAWGMQVGYTISAYNNMAKVHDAKGREVLLIGFQAFIPPHAKVAPGHLVFDVGYGRLEGGAWYLVRQADGRYELRRVVGRPDQLMVATRSIVASPFPGDDDALYLSGFDTNKELVHNTAWIVRTRLETAIGESR